MTDEERRAKTAEKSRRQRKTARYKEWYAEYKTRPEVIERRKKWGREYYLAHCDELREKSLAAYYRRKEERND